MKNKLLDESLHWKEGGWDKDIAKWNIITINPKFRTLAENVRIAAVTKKAMKVY